jgi:hypothetical protein
MVILIDSFTFFSPLRNWTKKPKSYSFNLGMKSPKELNEASYLSLSKLISFVAEL